MHINGFGRLFGGQLLQWIDELAGIVCRRHSGMGVTTASIDNLNFRRAAYQNDMIVLVGKLSYVGRTSMEVRVDTFIENEQGIRTNINRAYIVMVAIDQEGKPVPVPGIEIKTAEEELEWPEDFEPSNTNETITNETEQPEDISKGIDLLELFKSEEETSDE